MNDLKVWSGKVLSDLFGESSECRGKTVSFIALGQRDRRGKMAERLEKRETFVVTDRP